MAFLCKDADYIQEVVDDHFFDEVSFAQEFKVAGNAFRIQMAQVFDMRQAETEDGAWLPVIFIS